MEDICSNSDGFVQRDLYPSLRARSGSFATNCELWSGFVVERSDHELRGLGERSQWRQSHQLVRRLPRWQGERNWNSELDLRTANLPGDTRGPWWTGKRKVSALSISG